MGGFRVLTLLSLEYKFLRIANTYDWIIATAASRISRRICAEINSVSNVWLTDGPLFPNTVSSECPAIIFAVKRTTLSPCEQQWKFAVAHKRQQKMA
jgi:hypothetical protein